MEGDRAMSEKAITFSHGMVRAILDGRKTQTRRVVKPQPTDSRTDSATHDHALLHWYWCNEFGLLGDAFKCPYGVPGDRLLVRNTVYSFRIPLEVTDVRVQRLQDISIADIKAEGAVEKDGYWEMGQWARQLPRSVFYDYWKELHGKGSVADNPWVWVIEFKRVDNDL